jgi:valyl-tRNA synthetase
LEQEQVRNKIKIVKITPAHDFNDFECGKRHNLEFINILNDDGTLNSNGYPFEGKNRLDVREEIINLLNEKKLLVGQKDHSYKLNVCQRSKEIIEPMIKPQWYMECKELSKKSMDAVKNSELKILPKFNEGIVFNNKR